MFTTVMKRWLKFWYVIIIAGIVGAVALHYEKTEIQPVAIPIGETYHLKLVKLNVPADFVGVDTNANIARINATYVVESSFLEQSEKLFDYNKINLNWDNMSSIERIKWLNKVFSINYLGNHTYEFVFKTNPSNARDGQYLEDNGIAILDNYIQFSLEQGKHIIPFTDYTVIDTFEVVERQSAVTKETIVQKYIIIGFVIGALVAGSIISIITIGKTLRER